MNQRKNKPFIKLSFGYLLFSGQNYHAVSFICLITSMLSGERRQNFVNFTY